MSKLTSIERAFLNEELRKAEYRLNHFIKAQTNTTITYDEMQSIIEATTKIEKRLDEELTNALTLASVKDLAYELQNKFSAKIHDFHKTFKVKDFDYYKEELENLKEQLEELPKEYNCIMYSDEAYENITDEAEEIQEQARKLINEAEEQENISDEEYEILDNIKDDMLSLDSIQQKAYDNMMEWTNLTVSDRAYYMYE